MEHTCPHCGVLGDILALAEFPPHTVQCGNCLKVSAYLWGRMDFLLSEAEDFSGQINAFYMRPRWRTRPSPVVVAGPPPLIPATPPPFVRFHLRRLLRDYYRSFLSGRLQRKTIRGLYEALRFGELSIEEARIVRQLLAARNQCEIAKRDNSEQRKDRAQRRHGRAKARDGRSQSWRSR